MGYFLNRTVIVRTEEMQQAAVFCSCTSRDNKSSKRARKYREKDCVLLERRSICATAGHTGIHLKERQLLEDPEDKINPR